MFGGFECATDSVINSTNYLFRDIKVLLNRYNNHFCPFAQSTKWPIFWLNGLCRTIPFFRLTKEEECYYCLECSTPHQVCISCFNTCEHNVPCLSSLRYRGSIFRAEEDRAIIVSVCHRHYYDCNCYATSDNRTVCVINYKGLEEKGERHFEHFLMSLGNQSHVHTSTSKENVSEISLSTEPCTVAVPVPALTENSPLVMTSVEQKIDCESVNAIHHNTYHKSLLDLSLVCMQLMV